jgi:hypothetical protein
MKWQLTVSHTALMLNSKSLFFFIVGTFSRLILSKGNFFTTDVQNLEDNLQTFSFLTHVDFGFR